MSILFIKRWVKSDNEENIKQDKCIDYEGSYIVSQKCIFEEMTFKQKLKLKISLEKSSKHKKLLEQRSYGKSICDLLGKQLCSCSEK